MSVDLNALYSHPAADRLRIVELLWGDLGKSGDPIPIPQWVEREATRRREEMREPSFGISHDETWRSIERHAR